MNKRLLLALYDRSGLGAYMPVDYEGHELEVEEHMEKFVKLIVRECVEVCASIAAVRAGYNDADGRDTAYSCGDMIKEHFGVER